MLVGSTQAMVARQLQTNGRLLITGTPLQNNLHELWALLNYVLPDEFHSPDDFLTFFTQQPQGQDMDGVHGVHGADGLPSRGLAELSGLLSPLMLRRVKQDVERSLLPKIEINLYLPLTNMQRALYASILKKDLGLISGSEGDKSRLLNMVMQVWHPHPPASSLPSLPCPLDCAVAVACLNGRKEMVVAEI